MTKTDRQIILEILEKCQKHVETFGAHKSWATEIIEIIEQP